MLMFNVLKDYMNFIMISISIEKFEKLVGNLHDKTEYIIHIRNVKEALNHELFLKNVNRMIKCNSNVNILLINHALIF